MQVMRISIDDPIDLNVSTVHLEESGAIRLEVSLATPQGDRIFEMENCRLSVRDAAALRDMLTCVLGAREGDRAAGPSG